jgi:type I restriction-modification system DNA methylase subunit
LVSEQKFLAYYYTTIPAATLLAGLALLPDLDWTRVDALRELRVADPTCGTGTLLMAAYRQIVENTGPPQ